MIPGTSYSPGKAFIEFARIFFEALAEKDFQGVLGKLDSSDKKWSKLEVVNELDRVLLGQEVCSAKGFKNSASPKIVEIEEGIYQLEHKIPSNQKWSNAVTVFTFKQKPNSGYFYVYLNGFKP